MSCYFFCELPSDILAMISDCATPAHKFRVYCTLIAIDRHTRARLLGTIRQIDFSVPTIKRDDSIGQVHTEFPEPLLPVETLAALVSPCHHLESLNLAMGLTGCLREDAGWVDLAFPATRTPTLRSLVVDCTAGLGRCALARILERVAPSLEELTVTLEDIDWLYDALPRLAHLRALSLRGCPVDCRRLIPCAPGLTELTLGLSQKALSTLNLLLPHLASLERLDLPEDTSTTSHPWAGPPPLTDFRLLPNPARLRSVTVADWRDPVTPGDSMMAVALGIVKIERGYSGPTELYRSCPETMEEVRLAQPPDEALTSTIEQRMPRLRKLYGFPEIPGPLLLGRLVVLHLALPSREASDRDMCLTGAPCLREFRVRAFDGYNKRICLTLEDLPALELADTILFIQTLIVRRCPRLQCLEHWSGDVLQADGPLASLTSLSLNSFYSDMRPAVFLLDILREMPNLVELSRVMVTSNTECQKLFAALPRLASADLRADARVTQFMAPPSLGHIALQGKQQPVTIAGDGLQSAFIRGCRACTVRSPCLRDLRIVDSECMIVTLATPSLRTLVTPVTSVFREFVEEVPLAALRTLALQVAPQTDLDPLRALLRRPFVARLGRLSLDFQGLTPLETLGDIAAIPPPSVALDIFLPIATLSQTEFPALPNLRALTVRGNSDFVLHGLRAPALETIRISTIPHRESCSVRVPRDAPHLTRIVGGSFARRTIDWLQRRYPLILAAPDTEDL
ncbi:hypothetical protein PAPYR_2500 [Paratrimastix pyriformis]|uniref:Uncharacterized protein n=1 Tax=Paratrimastix pyriformis TaxID=342808 RepID=A0ABQ8UTK0_9EUKA|nr:hypothetical protein PAPYR_2500 [Paratrimastix pyriformis]